MCFEDFFGGKTRKRKRFLKIVNDNLQIGRSRSDIMMALIPSFRPDSYSDYELTYKFRNCEQTGNNLCHFNEFIIFKFDKDKKLNLAVYMKLVVMKYVPFVLLAKDMAPEAQITSDNEIRITDYTPLRRYC